MGLRSLDDSKEGISCFLKRNPNTCFVAYEAGLLIGAILSGMMEEGDIFIIPLFCLNTDVRE